MFAHINGFFCIRLFRRPGRLTLLLSVLAAPSAFAQSCLSEDPAIDSAKSNKLFLYFPTTMDSNFPSWDPDVTPLMPFNIAELIPGSGAAPQPTTDELIDQIKTVVADDYCDFNVQVLTARTNPERWPRRRRGARPWQSVRTERTCCSMTGAMPRKSTSET
jgi:hypothetical protein